MFEKVISLIIHFKILVYFYSYSSSLGLHRLRSFFGSYSIFIKHFKCKCIVCLFWALEISWDNILWVDVMENVILKRKVDIASHLAPFAFLIDLTKLLDSWYIFFQTFMVWKSENNHKRLNPFFPMNQCFILFSFFMFWSKLHKPIKWISFNLIVIIQQLYINNSKNTPFHLNVFFFSFFSHW